MRHSTSSTQMAVVSAQPAPLLCARPPLHAAGTIDPKELKAAMQSLGAYKAL